MSSTAEPPLATARASAEIIEALSPSSVGATLRAERVRRGWNIEDIAEQLRIRRVHLEAIEDDRFDLVPTGTYGANFVRAYAGLLGLDAPEMVRRLREQTSAVEQRLALNFPQPLPESRLPSGIVILTAITIAAFAYGAWMAFNHGAREPLARVDPVPARLAPLAKTPPPPPPPAPPVTETAEAESIAPAVEPVVPSPGRSAVATERVVVANASAAVAPRVTSVAGPGAAPVVAPPTEMVSGDGARTTTPPSASHVPAASSPTLTAPTAAPRGVYGEAGGGSRVVIHVQADSWIQVREPGGAVVFMRILKSGESYVVPNRAGLLLTTGNAGAVELRVDGRALPPLGRPGYVRRDVALDPDRLLLGLGTEPSRPAALPRTDG